VLAIRRQDQGPLEAPVDRQQPLFEIGEDEPGQKIVGIGGPAGEMAGDQGAVEDRRQWLRLGLRLAGGRWARPAG
jgi:hypothetical protein